MGVDYPDIATPDRGGHAGDDRQVEAWLAREAYNVNAVGAKLLAKQTNIVEAEDDRREFRAEVSNRFRNQHFGASHLHDVNDECDA
jgi:hypothetical protein